MPNFDMHNCRIDDSHIFIAGDANNHLPILHEAADEGMIAGYNAAHYPKVRTFKRSASLGVIFSEPQIMIVGRGYKGLLDDGIDFEVGEIKLG